MVGARRRRKGDHAAHLTDEATSLLSDPEPIARSDYDVHREAPFNRAINVYGDGIPE